MNPFQKSREVEAKKERLFSEIRRKTSDKAPLELIVEVDDNKRNSVYKELKRLGKCSCYKFIPYLSLECSPDDAERIANYAYGKKHDLRFERNFRYALENIISLEVSNKVSIPPEKPGINYYFKRDEDFLWNLNNIGVYDALKIADGKGVKIGIIDTGIDYTHPEVIERFGREKGYNFVGENSNPMDGEGHGTHVAGITAGSKCGIARGSTLYAIKVLGDDGSGSEADVMRGIEWALEKGISIVNMSLGSNYASNAFRELCYYASSKGMILCAAAGNDGIEGYEYPSSFEPVISVSAVDKKNRHADFSNINDLIDISAPGVDIVSSYRGGYRMLSGTSMATPHITGCLALMISNGSKSAESVMKRHAEPLHSETGYPDSEVFGSGLIQIDKMLEGNESYARLRAIFLGKNECNERKSPIDYLIQKIRNM
ncbi:MAG: S8 family serine peptidase [Candidatus Woesearchaeota archaeon]|nr:S8 family serine peptidase [Candidatus Woesearchaeota archaeon]